MSFARIEVMGYVGSAPESRYTATGSLVVTFSVAVNRSKRDAAGEWVDAGTDWFRCAVFGQQAERIAETVEKGSRVIVWGRFQSSEWEDRNHVLRTSLELAADKVYSLGKPERPAGQDDKNGAAFVGSPVAGGAPPADDRSEDDLPF